mmetsp:Transcript_40166/g.110418  ORF Transcript_40166/g.110418 Transcript_40166/m.110418 type:complete len:229 (+) Transcript_40166:287-973(+)
MRGWHVPVGEEYGVPVVHSDAVRGLVLQRLPRPPRQHTLHAFGDDGALLLEVIQAYKRPRVALLALAVKVRIMSRDVALDLRPAISIHELCCSVDVRWHLEYDKAWSVSERRGSPRRSRLSGVRLILPLFAGRQLHLAWREAVLLPRPLLWWRRESHAVPKPCRHGLVTCHVHLQGLDFLGMDGSARENARCSHAAVVRDDHALVQKAFRRRGFEKAQYAPRSGMYSS